MYTTRGIVLRNKSAGEVGAAIIIYTKDFGKISAYAQGIKKEEAKLRGHLETLSLSHIGFVLGRSGERLVQASLINFWPSIREDFQKLSSAIHIANLIDKHCFPGQKDEFLWDIVIKSFEELENNNFLEKDHFIFLRSFEKRFLDVLGYAGEEDLRILGV